MSTPLPPHAEPLEVYLFHAFIEHLREATDPRPIPDSPWTVVFKTVTGRRDTIVHQHEPVPTLAIESPADTPIGEKPLATPDEKTSASVALPRDDFEAQIQSEKQTAYRLLRVASWQVVFFLVTTDVLGPVSAPMAFAELGYGPGVLVYTFFFILAFASGQVLWRMYLHLDSEVYPITCYADLGERTFGPVVRHVFNTLQSLQLLFNVAALIVGNGQALATIIDYKFCYIAVNVVWAVAGALAGQVKRLRNFAWFTSVNIFLSLAGMALVLVGIASYPPIPSMSGHLDLSEPIAHSAWVPSYTVGWYSQVGGVQLAVLPTAAR
ncbi:hypothetical protein Q8F55_008417 [Vanrija albida]|uniref:Amino acid transporter transmembrane domain-containing protein n=1 Tax=Vanrija albida TaxID=181172 RepID=A0ABR3PWL2_9TREE